MTLTLGLTSLMILMLGLPAAAALLVVVADLIPAKPRPDPARSINAATDWGDYVPLTIPTLVVDEGRHRDTRPRRMVRATRDGVVVVQEERP